VQSLELHVSLLLIITSFLYCFPVPKKVLVWGAVVQDLDASFGFVVYTSTIPSSVERRVCEIAAGENFLSFCLVFLKFLLCENGYTRDSLTWLTGKHGE